MFTKEELEFIKNTMSKATVQGVTNMRLVLSIVEKCNLDSDTPKPRDLEK